MLTKSASTNHLVRAALCAGLSAIFFLYCPLRSLSAQETPILTEPFKKCRVYGGDNGLSRIVASDNESNIIITNDNYSMVSVNPGTNLENWKSQTGGKLETTMASDENNLYFVTSFEDVDKEKTYTLNSISLKTGITDWQRKLSGFSGARINQITHKELLFLTLGD